MAPKWTARHISPTLGVELEYDSTPVVVLTRGPWSDEARLALAQLIAKLLNEHERQQELAQKHGTSGPAWAVSNPGEASFEPITLDLVNVPDVRAHITLGPNSHDGLFLHCMRELLTRLNKSAKIPQVH